jgi:hypothetical protein
MKNYNTGIAAEYFILSQLYRQEFEAYVTIGNKKTMDIRIITPTGRTISLDVKAVRGYSSLIVNNVEDVENHYVALVIYKDKFEKVDVFPDVYIMPSSEVIKLKKDFKNQARLFKRDIEEYKDHWEYLK